MTTLYQYDPALHCWGCGEDAHGASCVYHLHYNATGYEIDRRFCSDECAAQHGEIKDARITK